MVLTLNNMTQALQDAAELLEIAAEEGDQETLDAVDIDLQALDAALSKI